MLHSAIFLFILYIQIWFLQSALKKESHQHTLQQQLQLQHQHQQQSLSSAGRLFDRLFAHHNVLTSELAYLQSNLEGRRGGMHDAPSVLGKTAADLANLTDTVVPAMVDLLQVNLPACRDACATALNRCAEIADRERLFLAALPPPDVPTSAATPLPAVLREGRAQRESVWREYMEEVRNKAARVDEDFAKEVTRLEAEYAELEAKLAM